MCIVYYILFWSSVHAVQAFCLHASRLRGEEVDTGTNRECMQTVSLVLINRCKVSVQLTAGVPMSDVQTWEDTLRERTEVQRRFELFAHGIFSCVKR